MPEDFSLVPPGMVPIDDEGKVKDGFEDQAKELGIEPGQSSEEKPEAGTDEKPTDTDKPPGDGEEKPPDTAKPDDKTGEEKKPTDQPVAGTDEKPTDTDKPPVDDKPEEKPETGDDKPDSSLKEYTVDDLIKEYDSAIDEEGATFSELIFRKTRDLDKMDEMEIIEEGLIFKTPDITDNELDVFIEEFDPLFLSEEEKSQKIEAGELDQRSLDILQAKFDRTVRENKALLKQDQDSIDLSQIKIKAPVAEKDDQPKELTAEQAKEVRASLEKSLETYDGETLKIVGKDGESLVDFKYEVDPEAKGKILDIVSNPKGIYSRWLNEDGSFNDQKYYSEIAKLENFDAMMKAMFDQAISYQKDKSVKDTNNITDSKTEPGKGGNEQPTAHDILLQMHSGKGVS